MSGLYKNKYRIESTRLPGWDYASAGFYFVTICAPNREESFGEVMIDNDGITSVALLDIGKIAQDCWLKIPKYHPYAVLDEFIIMPNHTHGIIQINKNVETPYLASQPTHRTSFTRGHNETRSVASLRNEWEPNQFGPQSKNLASIIRGYKSAVTIYARRNNVNFAWQPRYYDRIIRNENALNGIRFYINTNPDRWRRDRNNPENLWM